MFGIALAALANFFQELSDSIGKYEMYRGAISVYSFGFLTVFFSTIFILLEGVARGSLIFSLLSLPTFLPRLVLEVVQAHLTVRAVSLAERGDFGFVKSLTIPLLLIIDIMLGYSIGALEIAGMLMIAAAVFSLIYFEGHRGPALVYLYASAVNAAITISLYKYDITYFNSVEAEQGLIGIAVMLYFFVLARSRARENPFAFLGKGVFLGQSVASGLAGVAVSFAYLFAPASIITTALRSFAVLFALVSGRYYFREKHFIVKVVLFLVIAAGLLLILPG